MREQAGQEGSVTAVGGVAHVERGGEAELAQGLLGDAADRQRARARPDGFECQPEDR